MTSTRSTIPAPPPNGVSSTAPPLSGVVARGSTHSNVLPSASTLATWRCVRYQSNQPGNSVKTSTSIHEPQVDVDAAPFEVHGADGVAHERDQPVADLERLTGRERDHPLDDADLPLAVRDTTALQVARPELALLKRRRLRLRHAELRAAQRLGGVAGGGALDAQDRLLRRAGAPGQRDRAAAEQQRDAAGQELGVDAYHVKRPVEPVRPADVAGDERGGGPLTRRCRRGRGGCP